MYLTPNLRLLALKPLRTEHEFRRRRDSNLHRCCYRFAGQREAHQVSRPVAYVRDVTSEARTPIHVVSERLGHSKVSMTMEIYAHVLPDMHEEAATALGAILHG